MAGKPYTDAQKKQMVKLREKGMSLKDIGTSIQKKYKLDKPTAQPTISRILKEQQAIAMSSKSAGEIALMEAQKAKASGEVITESRAPIAPSNEKVNTIVDASHISSEALKNFTSNLDDSVMDDLANNVDFGNDTDFGDSLFDDLVGDNDSTISTKSSYTDYDMASKVDEIETSMNSITNMKVANLKASPNFRLTNDNKYFLETLLKQNQIRPIGFVVGGNLYFPSFNFSYLFQVQNATQQPNGFVSIINNTIDVVDESFFTGKLEEGITRSVKNFMNYIETSFNNFGEGRAITFNQLFENYNSPSATAFISVANILQQNKQLQSIQVLPKLTPEGLRELDLIVTVSTFGVKVLSFNK